MYKSQNKETYFERLKNNLNTRTLHVPAKQLGFCTHFTVIFTVTIPCFLVRGL